MSSSELDKKIRGLEDLQYEKTDKLLEQANVCGVGLSTKRKAGKDTKEPCIAVFVHTKVPAKELPRNQRIPSTLEKIKTDVIEIGIPFAGVQGVSDAPATQSVGIQRLARRVRPAQGGYSVGHFNITAGTFATAVYDATAFPGTPQRYYILSNNHVLADSNAANIGDPILQPGPYDGGVLGADTIARLSRYVPIDFTPGSTNYVDAAIAEGDFEDLDREIYWIGHVRGYTTALVGMLVQKTGRTTHYTTGEVLAVNATVNVNYGGGLVARFDRQILTSNMSAGGDSGSLLLDMDGHAVGLLFAGSSQVTIHNDIQRVEHLLGIQIR